jgi:hypothetical protein
MFAYLRTQLYIIIIEPVVYTVAPYKNSLVISLPKQADDFRDKDYPMSLPRDLTYLHTQSHLNRFSGLSVNR